MKSRGVSRWFKFTHPGGRGVSTLTLTSGFAVTSCLRSSVTVSHSIFSLTHSMAFSFVFTRPVTCMCMQAAADGNSQHLVPAGHSTRPLPQMTNSPLQMINGEKHDSSPCDCLSFGQGPNNAAARVPRMRCRHWIILSVSPVCVTLHLPACWLTCNLGGQFWWAFCASHQLC